MRVLGLTGGIGSGKSVVDAMFRELGAEVIDADVLAREIVEPGQPALQEIASTFGTEMLRADGRLDRARLGALIFGDRGAREQLNAITHPRIRRRLADEVAARRGKPGILILDIPLLYENGRRQDVEGVIVVWADRATQLRRVMERDGLSAEQAGQRIDAQLPLDEKRRLADHVVDNSGTRQDTERQVAAIYRLYA